MLELEAEVQRLRALAAEPQPLDRRRSSPLAAYLLTGAAGNDESFLPSARSGQGLEWEYAACDERFGVSENGRWSGRRVSDRPFTLPAPDWPQDEATEAAGSIPQQRAEDGEETFNAVMARLRNIEAAAQVARARRQIHLYGGSGRSGGVKI